LNSKDSKMYFYGGIMFHTLKQAQNSPVLDRNQLGGVTVNTYTTDRRREVVLHAAKEYILQNHQ